MRDHIDPTSTTILDARGHIAVDLPCAKCRYNLRTQPVSANCPECAHPVIETLTRYLPTLDHLGRVAQDLLCTSCGYNLRTLALTGICPECAAPVAQSARGRFLHLAPPRWLKRMAEGALQLTIGLVSPVVCYVIVMALGLLFIGGTGGFLAVAAGGTVVAVVGLWLIAAGTWRLTTPEPGSEFQHEGVTARKLARWCLLTLPLLMVGSLALTGLRLAPPGFGLSPVFSLFAVVTLVAFATLPLALLRHVRALMSRVPRPDLVAFAKIEFWAVLACAAVTLVGQVAFISFLFGTIPPAAWGTGAAMPPYAAVPNSPGATATTSAPIVTSVRYSSTTYTYIAPGGGTATMPASMPMITTPPFFNPALLLATVVYTVGGCTTLIAGIAGLVLLILVWRALANAARLAEQNALPNSA
jgi:Zn finger protein HypA/HybF involved in hydrogenase expression